MSRRHRQVVVICCGVCVCVYVLLQALGLYREVIKAQPDNIYAVNGIGTCLAGEGCPPPLHCTGGPLSQHHACSATVQHTHLLCLQLCNLYARIAHSGSSTPTPDLLNIRAPHHTLALNTPSPKPPTPPPCSELGHLAAAKEAFNEVIRATSRTKGFVKLPEAYVNIGHLGLAKKQYPDALRMYELAGRMNNQRDVQVRAQTQA